MSAAFYLIVFIVISFAFVRIVRGGTFSPWYTRLLGVFTPSYEFFGTVEEGFETVEELFRQNFVIGKEVGASVSVFSKGKKVVELYGGFQDFEKKIPYTEDTLQLVFSTSKVLESVAVARLVDQGYLRYEDKISDIWPEFGSGNKGDVTVEDLLRHEAGVTYFSDPQPTFDVFADLEKFGERLASQIHLWEGKKVRCYHALNRGWYLNEIVRRVHPLKRTLGKIYTEEINPLLGVEFYLGLPKEKMHRRSTWYPSSLFDILALIFLPSFLLGPKSSIKFNKEMFKRGNPFHNVNKLRSLVKDFENGEEILQAEIPSCNGFTNAPSLARIVSCLANKGTLDGKKLISEEGIKNALADCTQDYDTCLFINTTFSRGGFGQFTFPELGEDKIFYGWPGLGGSIALFNLEYNFSFSYVMNGSELSLVEGGRAKGLLVAAFIAHMNKYREIA